MNIRQIHKNKIKSILTSLNIQGQSIEVFDYFSRSCETYPYISILSGKLDPNQSSQNTSVIMMDSGTYDRRYEYNLMIVHIFDQKNLENLEKIVDELDENIVNLLQSQKIRDGGSDSLYYDLIVKEVSELFNGVSLELDDNYAVKFITVELRTLIPYS